VVPLPPTPLLPLNRGISRRNMAGICFALMPCMILIVDDHLDTGRLLARLLKSRGHDAVAVGSGQEGLDILPTLSPDLIILDKCMPEMDGLTVLRSIRADARSQSTPVLMYSADENARDVEQARRLGAQGYMVKGTTPWEDIYSTVARYV
jgi:twitching motility two-component system response regulator PilH